MTQRGTWVALLALASACGGGGGDGTDTSDDPAPDAPPAFRIATSTPAEGELQPLDDITLTFTEPLAPDSVDDASVVLFVRSRFARDVVARAWPAARTWDEAAETLTIAPRLALPPFATVELRLDGLISATSGDTLTTTANYDLPNRVSRSSQAFFDGDATQTAASLTTGPLDNDYDRVTTAFDNPGVDGDWGTDDDRIYSMQEDVMTSTSTARLCFRSGSGADGQWNTADDVFGNNSFDYVLDDGGLLLETYTRNAAGPDGARCTDDDIRARRYRYERDAEGRTTRYTDYTSPGPDLAFGTEDDAGPSQTVYTYDATGRLARTVTYVIGPDDLIGTADDVVFSYFDLDADADGLTRGERLYGGDGGDNTWFTGDDELARRTAWTYDDDGRPTGRITYDGPGADGDWETSDDDVAQYQTFEPLARGLNRGETTYFQPGMDGDWFTEDDEIFDRTGYEYGARGNLEASFSPTTAGPDGDFFTDDGFVLSRQQY